MMRTARFFTALVVSLAAFPALANEGAGLPQLDHTTYASQVFWLAVHFIILFFIAKVLILPRIATGLETRRRTIAADLNNAESLRVQSIAERRAYEASLGDARAQAQAARDHMAHQLQAEQKAAEAQLQEQLAAKAAAAQTRLAEATAVMRANIRTVAAEAAQDIVAKITGAADKALIEASLDKHTTSTLREIAS